MPPEAPPNEGQCHVSGGGVPTGNVGDRVPKEHVSDGVPNEHGDGVPNEHVDGGVPNQHAGQVPQVQPIQPVHPMLVNPWPWYAAMGANMFHPMMVGWRMPMMGWPQVVPQQQYVPVERTDDLQGHVQPGDGAPVEPASTERPVPPNPLLEPGEVPEYMNPPSNLQPQRPPDQPPEMVHESVEPPERVPEPMNRPPNLEAQWPSDQPPEMRDDSVERPEEGSDEFEYVEEEVWDEGATQGWTSGWNCWQHSWGESTRWNQWDGWEEMEVWYDDADEWTRWKETRDDAHSRRPLTVFSQTAERETSPKRAILPKKRPRPPAEDPPEHLLCRAFLQGHDVLPPSKAMPTTPNRKPVVVPPRFPGGTSSSSASTSVSGEIRCTWSVKTLPPED